MAPSDYECMTKAYELRKKAARYRYLAQCIKDETTVAILERMSEECDGDAALIEREVIMAGSERGPQDHAA